MTQVIDITTARATELATLVSYARELRLPSEHLNQTVFEIMRDEADDAIAAGEKHYAEAWDDAEAVGVQINEEGLEAQIATISLAYGERATRDLFEALTS